MRVVEVQHIESHEVPALDDEMLAAFWGGERVVSQSLLMTAWAILAAPYPAKVVSVLSALIVSVVTDINASCA
jgi:hypothetical protein